MKEYQGRPVIVIFYLGYGCLHCVEQLTTFAPRTKDFADAGISLIGIGTDGINELKISLENFKVDGEFPFPLLSDVELRVFKEYRAFDDFENQPLHGTFLIDEDGLVRWQDISYEPFADVDFLLKESKRLLRLPTNVTPQPCLSLLNTPSSLAVKDLRRLRSGPTIGDVNGSRIGGE